jgi:hypothetical protein
LCTLTWIGGPEGYELFFNRDELLTRGPETAPTLAEARGVRFIAPRDADGGGTWIAANEYGLTLCLLNGYGPSRGTACTRMLSRGALVLALVDASEDGEIGRRFAQMDLAPFRPFSLLVVTPQGAGEELAWDGLERGRRPGAQMRLPIASSSVDQEAAQAFRRAQLETCIAREKGLSPAVLERFHKSHPGGPGPLTPCMHRSDARTKSHCRVRVRATRVSFAYAPGPPCSTALREVVELERRSPRGDAG